MNEQELNDDLRIIEQAFDRTAYQASIDRATRTLSVDVLARLQQRRRFPAWKLLAAAVPVAAAVVMVIAPWSAAPTAVPTTTSPSVASAPSVAEPPAINTASHVATPSVASVNVKRRTSSRASATVTEEGLLSAMYSEQFVSGLSNSIADDQPTMFELTTQDLQALSMSVNNEDAF